MMKPWMKSVGSVLLAAAILTGCSFGGNDAKADKTSTTLKVMYYDENSFYQEYGMLFSALHPEIEIQVVSTQSIYRNSGEEGGEIDYKKRKQEFIDKEKPDILMVEMSEYEKMAQEGRFIELEAYIAKDQFDTEGLVPGMIDYMKELGGGKLYGFPSGFNSQALYYNKALFDKFNIAYPTDQMTWPEVIQLARQFPIDGGIEDRIYGIKAGYGGELTELTMMIANAEGLSFVNPTTKQMTINTTGWKNVLQTAYDALKSEALYFENMNQSMMSGNGSYEEFLKRNPFISGRLAMTIESSWFIREIKQAEEYFKEEGDIVKDWDIVTIPVSAQFPDQSSSTHYDNIFSISKHSANTDAAWKFISYISSGEYARVKSKLSYNNGFSIHTQYIKDDEGRNFAAFYKLKPSKQNLQESEFDKLPKQFGMMFYTLMGEEFRAVQAGTRSIDEALDSLQVKGEELLAQESMTDKELEEMWRKRIEAEQKNIQDAAGEAAASNPAE